SKPGAANVISEKTKSLRTGCDAIFGRLDFGEEPIAQLAAAFSVKVFQSEPKVGLNRSAEMQLHLPTPRRSSSHVIATFGSRSISSFPRFASATPSSSSS